ncbi:MAG: hypothetical protein ACYCW6_14505 [Candidatus Xenobia bacterium]
MTTLRTVSAPGHIQSWQTASRSFSSTPELVSATHPSADGVDVKCSWSPEPAPDARHTVSLLKGIGIGAAAGAALVLLPVGLHVGVNAILGVLWPSVPHAVHTALILPGVAAGAGVCATLGGAFALACPPRNDLGPPQH